jgi:transposase
MSTCLASGGRPIDLSSVFALPVTLALDTITVRDHTITIHIHATAATTACPRCGTIGSRIHSRYQRTITDGPFAGRALVFKLRVRKWICPSPACPQRIFAERFPDLVQRYGRMTERANQILQSIGVTTNGADAARIVTSLGMPTSAKTIIRRVLRLPVPPDKPVRTVGIDEWAWKKGHRYGTIVVDLEAQRVAALLPDRSVETTKQWLSNHPEIQVVSRDRGKLFREAADEAAPQAQQVVDRFHLQQNFAEALEKFFRQKTRQLQKVAQECGGKARHIVQAAIPKKIKQERQERHRRRVMLHKRVWKLDREGYRKEQIAERLGISSRSVYRVLEQEAAPPRRRRSRSASVVDPYLSYLSERWNQGCHTIAQLYKEISVQGYRGSLRTLERQLRTFRPQGAQPVSKQTVIFDKPPSPRGAALMIVRREEQRTQEQTAFLEQLQQTDPTIAQVVRLAQDFGQLLRQQEGVVRLEQWQAEVRASGIAELIAFVDGLADDAEAVANGCSLPWSNGMVEGFVNKIKAIKRSSYGQAGFPLLQRRVLLHPN